MKTWHGLQGQSLGFHFLIVSLNPARDSFTFISGGGGEGGINCGSSGPKYDAESDPL